MGRARTAWSPAFAAGLLAACSAERVEGADQVLRTAWERAEIDATPAASAEIERASAAGSWSLDAILDEIASANPTLGVAEARLEEARAVRREVHALSFPELSLGLEYTASDNPAQAFAMLLNQEELTLGPAFDPTPGTIENWRKELRVDWPLFAPGRGEARRSAEAGEEAARLTLEAAARRLQNAGVQAWIGLRARRGLALVARGSIAVVEQRLEVTRRRHAEGAALRADVLRLEVRLAAARQEAARAELGVREAESGLNVLMGRSPEAALDLVEEEVPIGAGLPEELSELFALAEAERLDLQAGAHRVRAFAFQGEARRAERLPLLGLFASYDIDGAEPAIESEFDSTTVGVGLHWPLTVRTGARIERAAAEERIAREELGEQALAVAREVRDAREALGSARETLALAEAATGAAEEAYRLLAAAQDAGAATVTDVLEAEDARRRADVQVVSARAGLELARARLVAATGGVR